MIHVQCIPPAFSVSVVHNHPVFTEQIMYIFNVLFSTYDVNCNILPLDIVNKLAPKLTNHLVISYGKEFIRTRANYQIHIYSSNFFSTNYLKASSLPQVPLKKYGDVHVIYSGNGDIIDWVQHSSNTIETNIDIVASSFFVLSRYKEVVNKKGDRHGAIPRCSCFQLDITDPIDHLIGL